MGLFKSLAGVIGSFFQVGGPSGPGIARSSAKLQIKNAANDTLANLEVGRASADTDASAYLDLKERVLLIEFSFDGGSPPSAGANTGKYGFCHTTGGAFTNGRIYYDTGTAFVSITPYKGSTLFTTSAVTGGTVSLQANGAYVASAAAAPYSWTLKGDGAPASTGLVQSIKVAITTADGASTTSLPIGTRVMRVYTNILTPYDAGATIEVLVGAVSVQSTAQNDATIAGIYENDPLFDVATAGVINVDISATPGSGSAEVIVEYIVTFHA